MDRVAHGLRLAGTDPLALPPLAVKGRGKRKLKMTAAIQRRLILGAGILAWKDFERLTSAKFGGTD